MCTSKTSQEQAKSSGVSDILSQVISTTKMHTDPITASLDLPGKGSRAEAQARMGTTPQHFLTDSGGPETLSAYEVEEAPEDKFSHV